MDKEIFTDDSELISYIYKIFEICYPFIIDVYEHHRDEECKEVVNVFKRSKQDYDEIFTQRKEQVLNEIFSYQSKVTATEFVNVLSGRCQKFLVPYEQRLNILSLLRPRLKRE